MKRLAAGLALVAATIVLASDRSRGPRDDPTPPLSAAVEQRLGNLLGSTEGCALRSPVSQLGFVLDGCLLLASDDGTRADPGRFWGGLDCEHEARHTHQRVGGDPAPRADGSSQADRAFRSLSVIDGDDVFGERCELGENSRGGPTAFYREGNRRATYVSVRLPRGFQLGTSRWQSVIQMKQSQPADNGGGTPVLSLKAFEGRWQLFHSARGPTEVDLPIWSAPARTGTWTRFAFDVTYSHDPESGSVKVYADLNGDGDFEDGEERSPRLRTNTLKTEVEGSEDDGLSAGEPVPSHLRVGIYHHPAIDCGRGCRVDVDNVQVLAP